MCNKHKFQKIEKCCKSRIDKFTNRANICDVNITGQLFLSIAIMKETAVIVKGYRLTWRFNHENKESCVLYPPSIILKWSKE